MKKYLLAIVFLTSLFAIQPAFAQNVKKVASAEKQQTIKPKFQHWSIAWNGGVCLLDGDFNSSTNQQIVPTSFANFAFNAQVEYMITPVWGLFVQYNYLPWSGSLRTNINAKGLVQDVTLNGTFNVINLFRSDRSKTFKWGVNVNVGAGVSFFKASSYEYNANRVFENMIDQKYVPLKRTFVIPVGLSVEYSPIEWLGIFLQAEYRMYQSDAMEGITAGNSKDFIPYAGLGLRYKIAASKKRGHIKTTAIMDHRPDRTDVAVVAQTEKMNDLVAKVDNMTDMLNSTIIPKIEELEKNQEDNTDSDGDGVPDYRDRHANTPVGSFVNYYGEPLTAEEINKIMGAQKLQRPDATIYYEKNLAIVSPDSEIAIAEIASQLYNNPEYKLEIIGYCDNSGNAEYNQKLSLSRAEAIKRILVKQYNIEENRITTSGKGKTKGPKDNFIVNRRADVFIVK